MQIIESFSKIFKEIVSFLGNYGDVVYVNVYVFANLLMKASLHATLVCGSCVLQGKRHGYVIIRSVGCYEGSFDLIFLL